MIVHRHDPNQNAPETPRGSYYDDPKAALLIAALSIGYMVLSALLAAPMVMFFREIMGILGSSDGEKDLMTAAFLLPLLITVFGLSNLIVAIGVMRSKRWAFALGILVNVFNGIGSLLLGGELPMVGVAIYAGIGVFCGLRLTGNLGAAP